MKPFLLIHVIKEQVQVKVAFDGSLQSESTQEVTVTLR